MQNQPPKQSPAFTLVEMAIVLVIVGILLAMFLGGGRAFLDAQKRKNVRERLDALDTALANFVAVNKRLPCPADGRTLTGGASAGLEIVAAGNCSPATQQHGVLPWVTLGLTEVEASDPWNARLTYRVDPALAASAPQPLLMNMSNCDPSSTGLAGAGGICIVPTLPCTGNANCTSPANYLAGKGLDVWNGLNGAIGWSARQNNTLAGTGAAYVLISHGPDGAGAYNGRSNNPQPGTIDLGFNCEERNAGNLSLAKPATEANAYCDGPLNDNDEAHIFPVPPPPGQERTEFHFDDYMSHPTIISVLNRAQLGPRAH